MALRIENKHFWSEFIDIYRNSPELWKVKTDEYKNKKAKDRAYGNLIKKMKELEPNADKDMVRKKINILRVSYRRELKKVVKSRRRKSVSENGNVHIPTLWYFDMMDFLREISREISSDEESNADDINEATNNEFSDLGLRRIDTNLDSPQYEIDLTKQEIMEPICETTEDEVMSEPMTPQAPQTPKEGHYHDNRQNLEHPATESTQNFHSAVNQINNLPSSYSCTNCSNQFQENDGGEADYLGKIWAIQYKKLDVRQQILAKKAIDDILFEARMGTLHRYSVSINHQHS